MHIIVKPQQSERKKQFSHPQNLLHGAIPLVTSFPPLIPGNH